MNYIKCIKRLERDNRLKAVEIVGLRSMVTDITQYLLSLKFHQEQWVNPQDILNRFDEGELITQRLIDETPD